MGDAAPSAPLLVAHMPTLLDYSIWALTILAPLYVCGHALVRGHFHRYVTLNLFMLASALLSAGRLLAFAHFGLASVEYMYFYYYSDCLLNVLLYFSILELYQQVFREMGVSRVIRLGSILLLAATAAFSFQVVRENMDHLTSRFVVELSRNLYFIGLVLTYLLWYGVMKLSESRTRLIQLVLAMGISFAGFSALYALRLLYPGLGLVKLLTSVMGCWLPLAWAYTFTRIPEEARLLPAWVALGARR